jgi:hypothetical protein
MAQRPVASSNFRIVDPPSFKDFRVPAERGPSFGIIAAISSPFGTTKLAQERNGFAQQRSALNIFGLGAARRRTGVDVAGHQIPFGEVAHERFFLTGLKLSRRINQRE